MIVNRTLQSRTSICMYKYEEILIINVTSCVYTCSGRSLVRRLVTSWTLRGGWTAVAAWGTREYRDPAKPWTETVALRAFPSRRSTRDTRRIDKFYLHIYGGRNDTLNHERVTTLRQNVRNRKINLFGIIWHVDLVLSVFQPHRSATPNSLPHSIRESHSLPAFKRHLKTHFSSQLTPSDPPTL